MISKKLFVKLLKDDIRKRSWLWIFAVLVFCLLLPGIALDGLQAAVELQTEEALSSYYLGVISKDHNLYFLYGTVVLAAICALSGFSYLHSKVRLDFYHSLPVTRTGWLALQYTSSILVFLVPAGVTLLEELFMGIFFHLVDGKAVLGALETYGIYFLIFLFCYSMFVAAMLLTGKLLVSILAMPAMFLFSSLVFWIYEMFQSTFYTTYYEVESTSYFMKYPSPGTLLNDFVKGWGEFVQNGMHKGFPERCFGAILIALAVFGMLNRWLYLIRKTESAGRAVVFPKIAGLIEVVLVVTASLGTGICLKNFSYTQSDIWFFGGLALGIVIFTALVDFVYSMDIHGILRKSAHIAAITVLTFGIALVFRFDLLGYDTYLPARDEISSMSVDNYGISSVYEQVIYSTDEWSSSSVDYNSGRLDAYQLTEYEPIYRMAENGRDNVKEQKDGESDTVYVNIRYDLTNGQRIYRTYWVDQDVYQENVSKLYEKPGFIKAMYPIFGRNEKQMESISANSVKNSSGYAVLESEEEKKAFAEIYKEELLTLKYEELFGEEMIGSLSVSYQTDQDEIGIYSSQDSDYPVLKRFTRTLAYLEKLGITFQEHLTAEEVKELEVWDVQGNQSWNLLALEAGKADWITESEKEELLGTLTYQHCLGNSSENPTYMITAYGEGGVYLQTFQVTYEDLPESVQDIVSRGSRKQNDE